MIQHRLSTIALILAVGCAEGSSGTHDSGSSSRDAESTLDRGATDLGTALPDAEAADSGVTSDASDPVMDAAEAIDGGMMDAAEPLLGCASNPQRCAVGARLSPAPDCACLEGCGFGYEPSGNDCVYAPLVCTSTEAFDQTATLGDLTPMQQTSLCTQIACNSPAMPAHCPNGTTVGVVTVSDCLSNSMLTDCPKMNAAQLIACNRRMFRDPCSALDVAAHDPACQNLGCR